MTQNSGKNWVFEPWVFLPFKTLWKLGLEKQKCSQNKTDWTIHCLKGFYWQRIKLELKEGPPKKTTTFILDLIPSLPQSS